MTITQEKPFDLAAIEARANAATPGPWIWFGHSDGQMHLFSRAAYKPVVMGFARLGMQYAQPMFRDPERDLLVKGSELARFQVCPEATSAKDPRVYRTTLIGFRNPDADFIAHARADVDALIARVHELEQQLADAKGDS